MRNIATLAPILHSIIADCVTLPYIVFRHWKFIMNQESLDSGKE